MITITDKSLYLIENSDGYSYEIDLGCGDDSGLVEFREYSGTGNGRMRINRTLIPLEDLNAIVKVFTKILENTKKLPNL